MPIIDYQKAADQSERNFFSDDKLSEKNKQHARKFFDAYNVSPARRNIVLKHLPLLLRETEDIKELMQDREAVNKLFKRLRSELGNSYYSTLVNCSLMFVRWLNDGEKPKGFKDIKSLSKDKQKRELKPRDMITWEDGEAMAKQTTSTQLKALIFTQLDGGFRPSELVDLNYGDVERKKEVLIVSVGKNHKTGARNVILYDCAPYLSRWLEEHPTKKANDPLWLQEHNTRGIILRYEYPALQKRIRLLGEKAKIDKPLDIYNFRHSAATLKKKEGTNPEWAAKNLGHSVEHFTGTYGRLSTDDDVKIMLEHKGVVEEKTAKKLNVTCPKCDNVNKPKSEICQKCGSPLTIEKALEMDKSAELQRQLEELRAEMFKMFKEKHKKDIGEQYERKRKKTAITS